MRVFQHVHDVDAMNDMKYRRPPASTGGWPMTMITVLILIGILSCSASEPQRLCEMAPPLDPEMAEHLVLDDDTAFAAYIREIGFTTAMQADHAMRNGLADSSTEEYESSVAVLGQYIMRIERVIAGEYDLGKGYRVFEWLVSQPPEIAIEALRRTRAADRVLQDTDLSLEEKIRLLEQDLRFYEQIGYELAVTVTMERISYCLNAAGRQEDHRRRLDEALDHARKHGHIVMLCQILGLKGAERGVAGQTEVMQACFNEVLDLAERHRLPVQAARILSFLGNYHEVRGNYSLASDLYRSSVDRCLELGGQALVPRFMIRLAEFYGRQVCWEAAGGIIQEARAIVNRELPGDLGRQYEIIGKQLDRIEAGYLMAVGEVDRGEAIYQELEQRSLDLDNPKECIQLMYSWGHGLLQNNCAKRAVPVLQRGVEYAVESNKESERAITLCLLAEAQVLSGDYAGARETLLSHESASQALKPEPRRLEQIITSAFWISLHRTNNDPAAVDAAVALTAEHLERYLSESTTSTEDYIRFGVFETVRRELRKAVGEDPVSSYRLEMLWDTLGAKIGGSKGIGDDSDRAAIPSCDLSRLTVDHDDNEAWCRGILDGLASRGAVHLLYRRYPEGIVRWMATPGGIERTLLSANEKELTKRVEQVLAELAVEPGDHDSGITMDCSAALRELAGILLPRKLLKSGGEGYPSLILVSADDVLERVPFDALDIGEADQYVPLLCATDVARLRWTGLRRSPAARGTGLAVVDPLIHPFIRRRYPNLPKLEYAPREAGLVISSFPGTKVLSRESATKQTLLDSWEVAPYIHFACHFVNDPEAPSLAFIPLSPADDDSPPEDSYLDIGDIRSADLRACELVTLSGCSSGSRIASRSSGALGLGDAFLDSGAGAVIETGWSVRDDIAYRLDKEFFDRSNREHSNAVHALCEAKRALMNGEGASRHPYYWAAFSIKLGGL